MTQIACCLLFLILVLPLVIIYLLCLLFGSIFVGPDRARAGCQPILDQITKLANCCSGKRA